MTVAEDLLDSLGQGGEPLQPQARCRGVERLPVRHQHDRMARVDELLDAARATVGGPAASRPSLMNFHWSSRVGSSMLQKMSFGIGRHADDHLAALAVLGTRSSTAAAFPTRAVQEVPGQLPLEHLPLGVAQRWAYFFSTSTPDIQGEVMPVASSPTFLRIWNARTK